MPVMQYSLLVAGLAGFVAFFVGHASADLFWFSFVSYSVHKGRKFLNLRAIQLVVFASGVFLILFGVSYMHLAYVSM